jgi:hypothetical protein
MYYKNINQTTLLYSCRTAYMRKQACCQATTAWAALAANAELKANFVEYNDCLCHT